MSKHIIFLALLCLTQLNAINSQEISKMEDSVNNLEDTVNHYYRVINDDTPKQSIYDLLDNYSSNESLIISKWLAIASQSFERPKLKIFAEETKRVIKLYLGQLLLRKHNPMSLKDFEAIKHSIMYVKGEHFTPLNKRYITKTDINFRNLPILAKITKKSIIRQKSKILVLYTIAYQTKRGKMTQWAYVLVNGKGRGWVNMRNLNVSDS